DADRRPEGPHRGHDGGRAARAGAPQLHDPAEDAGDLGPGRAHARNRPPTAELTRASDRRRAAGPGAVSRRRRETPLPTYTAPLRDMRFVLNELAGTDRLRALPGCEEIGDDLI